MGFVSRLKGIGLAIAKGAELSGKILEQVAQYTTFGQMFLPPAVQAKVAPVVAAENKALSIFNRVDDAIHAVEAFSAHVQQSGAAALTNDQKRAMAVGMISSVEATALSLAGKPVKDEAAMQAANEAVADQIGKLVDLRVAVHNGYEFE